MATVRTIEIPPELIAPREHALSPDGRTVACRVDGPEAGIWVFEVGGTSRPVVLDDRGRRHRAPSWSEAGDLLFHVDGEGGAAGVGVAPAFGRGSVREYPGTGIAVSADGRIVAVADPASGALRVAAVEAGNSPFNAAPVRVGALAEADLALDTQVEISRDGKHVLVVRRRAPDSPSLWAYPVEGGDAQEVAPAPPAPATLSFALGRSLLATLEIRHGPAPSSRVSVRPFAPGSLGAVRLGPALDLLFVRQALPPQRPALSPDGKRLAILGEAVPPLPGGAPSPQPMALDLLPTAGGRPERAAQGEHLRGVPRFLASGEVVIEGLDGISVVTL